MYKYNCHFNSGITTTAHGGGHGKNLLWSSGGFKEKGPVSSLRWYPSVAFFPGVNMVKCFFPVEVSILVAPKQISVKSKKRKNKQTNNQTNKQPKTKTKTRTKNKQKQKQKKKKKKKNRSSATHACYSTGALWPSCLRNFSFSFSFLAFLGPRFFGGGPENNILGGPVSSCWHCWLLNPPLLWSLLSL